MDTPQNVEFSWMEILVFSLSKYYVLNSLNYLFYIFQYISLYTQKTGHIPPRFEKLVKLSGTHLTQYVYAMITYVQVR